LIPGVEYKTIFADVDGKEKGMVVYLEYVDETSGKSYKKLFRLDKTPPDNFIVNKKGEYIPINVPTD